MNSYHSSKAGVDDTRRWEKHRSEDLADAVGDATQNALEALWQFYNRPLPNKVRWAFCQDQVGLAGFVQLLGETPAELVSFCRRTLSYDSLTDFEAKAIGTLIAIYDNLSITGARSDNKTESIFLWKGMSVMEGSDRRSLDRQSTTVAADVRYEGLQYHVLVRNLTSQGAMVEGLIKAKIGCAASLSLPDKGWIPGLIAWSLGNRCGIAFNDAIELPTALE